MRTRTILATLAIPATALGLFAQPSVTIASGQNGPGDGIMTAQVNGVVRQFPDEPGNFKFFTQEFTFNGRPVTGAPYSADEKTESVQTLADGTNIANTTTERVYRDSQGRTRHEISLPAVGGETQPRTMISISDPVAGVSYSLDPARKIAHAMPVPPSFAGQIVVPAAESRTGEGAAIAMAGPQIRIVRGGGGEMASKHEDLGANVMEGVNVTGSRETSTIEAGAMGNDRAITITSERWYSPELQIEVKSVHNDPRMGQITHTVTNISRTEPDASLFQVPSDYKLDAGRFRNDLHQ